MVQIANGAFCGDPSNMFDDTTVWTTTFLSRVRKNPKIVHWYQDWFRDTRKDWDLAKVNILTARGELPLISWAPRNPNLGNTDPTYNHAAILAGTHDAYIDDWATKIADYGGPILLRPMWEMNLTVYNWGIGVQSQTNTTFINTWRYLVDAFDALGATNVKWVWCPYVSATSHAGYYPGDSYVDYTGLDGYNNQASTTWQTFTQVFGASYTNITGTVAPSKPLIICEYASMETNGDKAAWIKDAYDQIQTTYPRIRAMVYFDQDKTSAGEKDWRLSTTTAALEAYNIASDSPQNQGMLERGPQVVQETETTSGGTNSLSNTGSLPSDRVVNDVMIAALGKGQFYPYGTSPTGWAKFAEATDVGILTNGNARLELWWKRVAGGEATPVWTVTDGAATAGVHLCTIALVRGCKTTGNPFEGASAEGTFGSMPSGTVIECPEVLTKGPDRRILGVIFTRMASGSPLNASYGWVEEVTEEWETNHSSAGVNASTLGGATAYKDKPGGVTPMAMINSVQDRYMVASFALRPEDALGPTRTRLTPDAILAQVNDTETLTNLQRQPDDLI